VRAARAALFAAVLAALPRASEACAVCMSGREDDTNRAFLIGTILLSVLPLALIGGIAWWIRRRASEVASTASRPPQPAA
jgi:hypothetical protein